MTPSDPADVSSISPKTTNRVKSSVPAGTPLKGLGFTKGKDPPVALEDHEYPDWLWGLLDDGQKVDAKGAAENEGDAYGQFPLMSTMAILCTDAVIT